MSHFTFDVWDKSDGSGIRIRCRFRGPKVGVDDSLARAEKVRNYDEFFHDAIEVKKRDAEIPGARKRGTA